MTADLYRDAAPWISGRQLANLGAMMPTKPQPPKTTQQILSEILQGNLSKSPELAAKQGRLLEMLKNELKVKLSRGSTDSPQAPKTKATSPTSEASLDPYPYEPGKKIPCLTGWLERSARPFKMPKRASISVS